MKFAAAVALIFCIAHNAAAETKIVAVEGSGLFIDTVPSMAKVFLDGVERGRTPLTLSDVTNGGHSLHITKDFYTDYDIRFTMPNNGALRISADLIRTEGALVIRLFDEAGNAIPVTKGVKIIVDSQTASGTSFKLSGGPHEIEVSVFGKKPGRKNVLVSTGKTETLDIILEPVEFDIAGLKVSARAFNPRNSGWEGLVKINWTVTAAGGGALIIEKPAGNPLFSFDCGDFTQNNNSLLWGGLKPDGTVLSDGEYFLHIEGTGAGGAEIKKSESVAVSIDSSLDNMPVSITTPVSGLIFAPVSGLIAKNSFMLSATLYGGKLPGSKGYFDSLDFAAGLLWAPAGDWQISAGVNLTPRFEGDLKPAVALSVKKFFIAANGLIPSVSAAFSYGWALEASEAGAALFSGATLTSPLSWKLPLGFSLHFAPALLWTGAHGYPAEAAPRLLLSQGIMYKNRAIAAGFSAKESFTFDAQAAYITPFRMAAEFYFYPPRTAGIIGIALGTFLDGGEAAFFGALTLSFTH
ncbi:hypothetical protein FACS1894190_01270 [Spirochaetia bacterium]|nr:hypothetical protein FACS1894190_01270 [Spirochaetia bacterium]